MRNQPSKSIPPLELGHKVKKMPQFKKFWKRRKRKKRRKRESDKKNSKNKLNLLHKPHLSRSTKLPKTMKNRKLSLPLRKRPREKKPNKMEAATLRKMTMMMKTTTVTISMTTNPIIEILTSFGLFT